MRKHQPARKEARYRVMKRKKPTVIQVSSDEETWSEPSSPDVATRGGERADEEGQVAIRPSSTTSGKEPQEAEEGKDEEGRVEVAVAVAIDEAQEVNGEKEEREGKEVEEEEEGEDEDEEVGEAGREEEEAEEEKEVEKEEEGEDEDEEVGEAGEEEEEAREEEEDGKEKRGVERQSAAGEKALAPEEVTGRRGRTVTTTRRVEPQKGGQNKQVWKTCPWGTGRYRMAVRDGRALTRPPGPYGSMNCRACRVATEPICAKCFFLHYRDAIVRRKKELHDEVRGMTREGHGGTSGKGSSQGDPE